jgi:membrane-associated phospholipid phosphatase
MALYASFMIMATTIERAWLRRTVIGVCSVIPVLVAYARLYRGMHHLSDVVVGAINGLLCAGLAAGALVHGHRLKKTSRRGKGRPAKGSTSPRPQREQSAATSRRR